jgi:hypothetical protein
MSQEMTQAMETAAAPDPVATLIQGMRDNLSAVAGDLVASQARIAIQTMADAVTWKNRCDTLQHTNEVLMQTLQTVTAERQALQEQVDALTAAAAKPGKPKPGPDS